MEFPSKKDFDIMLKGVRSSHNIIVQTISKHAYERSKKRNFKPEDIKNILENYARYKAGNTNNPNSYKYFDAQDNAIILGNDGIILTVIGGQTNGSFEQN